MLRVVDMLRSHGCWIRHVLLHLRPLDREATLPGGLLRHGRVQRYGHENDILISIM